MSGYSPLWRGLRPGWGSGPSTYWRLALQVEAQVHTPSLGQCHVTAPPGLFTTLTLLSITQESMLSPMLFILLAISFLTCVAT